MPGSSIAALALGAQVEVAETGAKVQSYVEQKRMIHAFLACITQAAVEGASMGTLPLEMVMTT